MALSHIKAVTFDAAHTIYHPHPSVGEIYQEVMQLHGLDYPSDELEAGFRRAFRNISKDTAILDGEKREWSYWHSIVLESISQLSPQPKDFAALFGDLWNEFSLGHRWRPETTAFETITQLRARGYKTALLTNWDHRVRRVVAETGFADSFDRLFISSEIGHEKPAPEIFDYCRSSLGLAPEQILHVGDSLQHDIQGAQAAGWSAVRISEENEVPTTSCRSIRKLSELLDFL
ncbi:HAD-IA family hydrolase [Pelagicoccus sp. SDUM812002]|uniref:HAD-IA family hydrolase n=1 Tax=Pelagicoccus sp. SDUM812002 TaxID=3041266 RepID=UPI00280F6366|nr:HAD-IA family hydrolase [Pelagicoccus sp. SDUM812002]MDQ8185442.1 HAD-IA family hydrolase [Pelagicoccus sp. SDUM812002]